VKREKGKREEWVCVHPMISPPFLGPMPTLASPSLRSEHIRVCSMELVDKSTYLGVVKVDTWLPGIFFVTIVQPLDQILHSSFGLPHLP